MNNEIKQNRPDDSKNLQNEDYLEDYGYPDGYEPQKTSRTAMIIAVIAAVFANAMRQLQLIAMLAHDQGRCGQLPVRGAASMLALL